jgi:putative redox protein
MFAETTNFREMLMETIRTVYLGELRTLATHVNSGKQVLTDVPIENGGHGESFSPTDLFCASLVSSMLTVLGGVAKSPAFNGTIDGMVARATKTMNLNPHMVSEIVIEFDMPKKNYSAEQKEILESSVRNSQVGRSLNDTLKLTLVFNY